VLEILNFIVSKNLPSITALAFTLRYARISATPTRNPQLKSSRF